MNVQAANKKHRIFTPGELARTIDHTVLKSTAKEAEIKTAAGATKDRSFRALVVRQYFVPLVKNLLTGTNSLCSAVCDFPDAMDTTENRVWNLGSIYRSGADEIDIVSKYHLILDGNQSEYKKDIKAVIKVADNRPLKIILETDYLSEEQIRLSVQIICDVAKELKTKNLIIKTNTGYAKEVKTENIDAVRFIRETLEKNGLYAENIEDIKEGKIGIKVSARIKTNDAAVTLLNKGAHIIGTSSGEEIMAGA